MRLSLVVTLKKMLKLTRSLPLVNYQLAKCLPQHFSTKPARKEDPQQSNYDDQLKEYQTISNIERKIRVKKPQKPPFVKNLLLGVFDTDLLAYPELEKEELTNLENNIRNITPFLSRPEIKDCDQISKEFLRKLAKEKLLGLQTSQLMGGRELSVRESCRFNEIISEINLKNNILINENFGVQTLLKFGNDDLKRKYLQKLIDGEILSAFCIVSNLPSNRDTLNRAAVPSSGEKTWVSSKIYIL